MTCGLQLELLALKGITKSWEGLFISADVKGGANRSVGGRCWLAQASQQVLKILVSFSDV